MDFGLGGSVGVIASSTTGYLSAFSPIFLLIGGIVLALGVIERLLDYFFPPKVDNPGTPGGV